MTNPRANHLDFLSDRLGPNWVLVGRRSKKPMYDRRGNVQTQVTRAEYAAAERAWREQYGDPYDMVRADLYTTLRDARGAVTDPDLLARIDAALAAELG